MMQVNFPFLQAGIEKDQIEIALEPESASLYCRSVKTCRAQEAGAGLSNFPVGTRYMVLDCGGTVLCTSHFITKTCLYNIDPLKPHFYIVKLGFTGVYINLLISALKHRLWVLVRTASPRRFERVPTIYTPGRNIYIYIKKSEFLSENF